MVSGDCDASFFTVINFSTGLPSKRSETHPCSWFQFWFDDRSKKNGVPFLAIFGWFSVQNFETTSLITRILVCRLHWYLLCWCYGEFLSWLVDLSAVSTLLKYFWNAQKKRNFHAVYRNLRNKFGFNFCFCAGFRWFKQLQIILRHAKNRETATQLVSHVCHERPLFYIHTNKMTYFGPPIKRSVTTSSINMVTVQKKTSIIQLSNDTFDSTNA